MVVFAFNVIIIASFFYQYFNNEQYEAEKYGKYLTRYQEASLKTTTSLAFLNFGQNFIFSSALTVMMLLASQNIMQGKMENLLNSTKLNFKYK